MSQVKERLEALKRKLLDPFDVDGLEEEFALLLGTLKELPPEELEKVKRDWEEVKALLYRNLEIVSGGLKPLLRKANGSFFSRRV